MRFSLYIAQRYLRSKSSQNAVNIINFITFLVIVIGSAALFVVLSAFSGLKSFSLQFSNAFDPDLKALPTTGKFFSITPEQEKALNELTHVTHFSKELEERVYLTYKDKSHLATLKGVDRHYEQTTGVDSTLYFGNWGVNEYSCVIGLGVFNILGVPVNNFQSPMMALAPKPGKGSINQQVMQSKPYNSLPLVVSGVFSVEESLDRTYLFTQLATVQQLLEKDSLTVSGINFKVANEANLEKIKKEIRRVLSNKVQLLTRQELNGTLYKMLKTENLATYLIFTLVLIIALFNLVGAIIMMILDKQQNSRTLYALGTTIGQLRRIYLYQGIMTTFFGGVFGVFLGLLLVGSQLLFGWIRITPSLAYPVAFEIENLVLVLATIFVLGLISSKIGSSRITKKLLTLS